MKRNLPLCECYPCPNSALGGQCFKEIFSTNVVNYSKKTFGKSICFKCQDHQPASKELEEAKSYINYGIKEGIYDGEDFEDMTDRELIDFANKEEGRALATFDSQREEA